jgi:hypothetical protein
VVGCYVAIMNLPLGSRVVVDRTNKRNHAPGELVLLIEAPGLEIQARQDSQSGEYILHGSTIRQRTEHRPLPSGLLSECSRTPSERVVKLAVGTGVEPATARVTVWCSSTELTEIGIAVVRTRSRNTPG